LHENDKIDAPRNWDVLIPPILSWKTKEELLLGVFEMVRPFVDEGAVLDFQLLPPFVTYLAYKGAMIFTTRLRTGADLPLSSMKMLKSMRSFLKLVSSRWLIASESILH
jgi:hypothetical protein